jgi:hypothetical protein
MRGSRALTALAAVLMLAGCANTRQTTTAPPTPAGSWTPPGSSRPPTPSAWPSLTQSRSVTPSATSASPTESLAAQAIPWLDAPVARPKEVPDPNAQFAHPVLYRPCTAADLTARALGWGGAMGTGYEFIDLTNRSSSACTLEGKPRVITNVYRDGSRHLVPLSTEYVGYGNGLDAVANLQPGQVGQTQLRESDSCPGFQHFFYVPRVDVTLPDGTQVTVIVPGSHYQAPSVGCGATASWFGTAHRQVPEPTYPTSPLVVTTTLPGTVKAGQVVDYTVTLTNPTDHAVPLTPCPSYEEVISSFPPRPAKPDVVDDYYRLNCDGHHEIPPHSALRFAMRITAPQHAGFGRGCGWFLLPLGSAGSGCGLTVG